MLTYPAVKVLLILTVHAVVPEVCNELERIISQEGDSRMGLVCDSITGRGLRKSKIRFLTQTDQSKITRILVDQKNP